MSREDVYQGIIAACGAFASAVVAYAVLFGGFVAVRLTVWSGELSLRAVLWVSFAVLPVLAASLGSTVGALVYGRNGKAFSAFVALAFAGIYLAWATHRAPTTRGAFLLSLVILVASWFASAVTRSIRQRRRCGER